MKPRSPRSFLFYVRMKWATIPTMQALISPLIPPFDLHRSVHKLPCVTSSLAKCEIKSQPLDLINEINEYEYITCV